MTTLSPSTAALDSTRAAPAEGRLARLGLPPPPVLRAYLLGWIPLFLVYMVAVETDGDLSNGFNVPSAAWSTFKNIGPAAVLLVALWAYTGWMERRAFGVPRVIFNHAGMALVFAVMWHVMLYGLFWLIYDHDTAERARQRWFIWQIMWGMMMYWTVAGGFTAYRAVQHARAEAAVTAQAQTLLARSELAALRNKLNPHFLFNTLHSIIALTRKDSARAEAALLMFSDMLRYVLETEKTGRDQVPLQQELDFTRDYLALEALRLGPRLTVDWQVDPAALSHPVPALSIQPIVENSIQHAFNPRSAPGRLVIQVRLDSSTSSVRVDVSDDGPGCSPDALHAGQGLGLKTVARRLLLQFGTRGGLHIETSPGAGFAARFSLPIDATLPS